MSVEPIRPKRASRGSLDSSSTLLLRLSSALRRRMDRAARASGLSASEWIRRVAERALEASP